MKEVLVSIASGSHTPTTIGKAIKKDKSHVYRTLKRLRDKGLVTQEKGTKQYFLSNFGTEKTLEITVNKVSTKPSKGLRSVNEVAKTRPSGAGDLPVKRGHNIRAKFAILKFPKGWKESPKQFFELQNVDWEPLHLKNVDAVQFTLDDVLVKATSKSIVLMPRKGIYVDSTAEAIKKFMILCFNMKGKLQKLFPLLKLSERPEIIVGEIAHEEDIVATLKKAEGFTVIKHTDNRARVILDGSPGEGIREIDFVHVGMFDEDSETWERRILQMLDSPYDYDMMGLLIEQADFRLDRTERLLEMTAENQARMSGNQEVFDKNMSSHLRVLGGIEKGVFELRNAVKGISGSRLPKKGKKQPVIQQGLYRWFSK